MSDYTQGICEDGAAILKDGQMVTIEEILAGLRERDQLRAELEECTRAWRLTTSELAQERERVRVAGSEAIRKMCEAWLSEAGDLPNQHENKSRGCSTYNWQTHYARAGLAHADRISALSAGEGGECD